MNSFSDGSGTRFSFPIFKCDIDWRLPMRIMCIVKSHIVPAKCERNKLDVRLIVKKIIFTRLFVSVNCNDAETLQMIGGYAAAVTRKHSARVIRVMRQ